MTIRRLCILGATGSIGASTLAVVDANPDAFEVVALSGHRNLEQMVLLCQRYRPQAVVMADAQLAQQLTQRLQDPAISIGYGDAALCELAADSASDTVVAAVVGAAGLAPTLAAVTAGKRVLLANKEALVMSGALFIDAVRQHNAQLLPIDSEHNAIFQCLPSQVQQQLGYCDIHAYGIRQLILTGSGGPFRQTPIADLAAVTPAQACKHPNWSMGQKISVDSATMMNKGLEFIEAKWLFNCRPQDIEVVVHPQSVVHSMVQYQDGSVLAQLGQPDMQTPIAHALSFPERCRTEVASLDWRKMNALTFEAPDFQRFACLKLAIDACHAGQEACTILNAANEIAVAGFLAGAMRFTDIAVIVEQTLSQVTWQQATNLESLIELDRMSRTVAKHLLSQRNAC